jgi:Ca2+-binding EF-hand superfamily protein
MHHLIRPLVPSIMCLAGLVAGDEPRPPQPPPFGDEQRDPVEMAAHMNRLKERDPERFKRIDANADGTISPDEAKAWAEKERSAMKAKMKEAVDAAFIAADKDKDGKLDKAEFAEGAQDLGKRMREGMKDRLHERTGGDKRGKDKPGAPDAPPAKPF